MKKYISCLIVILLLLVSVQSFAWETSEGIKWRVTKHTSSALNGDGANGSHGDITNGAKYNIFTVTGDIIIFAMWAVINTTVDDAGGSNATLKVGVAGNTAYIIALIQADLLLDGNIWTRGANNLVGVGLVQATMPLAINDGADISEITGTADVTDGQIDYYIIWSPVEIGASVVSDGTISDLTP